MVASSVQAALRGMPFACGCRTYNGVSEDSATLVRRSRSFPFATPLRPALLSIVSHSIAYRYRDRVGYEYDDGSFRFRNYPAAAAVVQSLAMHAALQAALVEHRPLNIVSLNIVRPPVQLMC